MPNKVKRQLRAQLQQQGVSGEQLKKFDRLMRDVDNHPGQRTGDSRIDRLVEWIEDRYGPKAN